MLRLITAVVVDTHVAERRYLSEESMVALAAIDKTEPGSTASPGVST